MRAEGTPVWMLHWRRVCAVMDGARVGDERGRMRRTSHSLKLLPGMRESLDRVVGVMIHLMTLARMRGLGVEDWMAWWNWSQWVFRDRRWIVQIGIVGSFDETSRGGCKATWCCLSCLV